MYKHITTALCTFALALTGLLASPTLALAAPPADEDESSEVAKPVEGLEGQVNINTASQAELELLPGIGPSIAGKMISYRNEQKFEQLNHVMRIKGIGKKTYAKIKPYLKLEGESNLRSTK
ncbi:ComEA family DNA-binding protein [Nannocystaceae bacterium ST9]